MPKKLPWFLTATFALCALLLLGRIIAGCPSDWPIEDDDSADDDDTWMDDDTGDDDTGDDDTADDDSADDDTTR